MATNTITENEVKNFIKSILASTPYVCTIENVQRDYRDQIGTSIPFRAFNYNSIEHFLKSIPDICQVNGTGPFAQVTPVITKKSAHINQMVTSQKISVKGRKKGPRRVRRRPTYFGEYQQNASNNYSFPPNDSYDESSSDDLNKFSVKNTAVSLERLTTVIFENSSNLNTANGPSKLENNATDNKDGTLCTSHTKLKVENISSQNNSNCSKLNDSTLSVEEDLHFTPVLSNSSNKSHNSDYNKFNKLKTVLDYQKEKDEEKDVSNVPKRIQSNLQTLISQFSDGIWCSDLPTQYKEMFKKDLQYMDYGYTSLIDMCIRLKNIFHYVRPERDDFKLYDRNKPLSLNAEKMYTISSYDVKKEGTLISPLPHLEWSDFSGFLPSGVFNFGVEIPREFVPKNTQEGDVFDVVVVEVYDPSKFWFYIGTSDKKAPLDYLMDELQIFYNDQENAKNYAISAGAIQPELYCVQMIYGEYHRGKIVRVYPNDRDHVRVLYIDYGTVCKVPIKGMCYLHPKFATLPAQAIRCRLANVVPKLKGHPWPSSTCESFRSLMNRRDTKIKISYIDWDEEYVCVFLADVTNPDDVKYINEMLVDKGLAAWEGEAKEAPLLLPNFKCKVQNLHMFPTFLELEYGLTPNAEELNSLEHMYVPLQFSIPQYFMPDEQVCSSSDANDLEYIENCFIQTVKDHRKFIPLGKVDISALIKPSPIDFDVFGDLKHDIFEYYSTLNKNDVDLEEEVFRDVEEGKHFENYNRRESLKTEPLSPFEENKALSESIIMKLQQYSISECNGSTREAKPWDFSYLSEDNVSTNTTFQPNNYNELKSSLSECLETSIFDIPNSDSEKNIFDHPEAFKGSSEDLDVNEAQNCVTPESFDRIVEKLTRRETEGKKLHVDALNPSQGNSKNPFATEHDNFRLSIKDKSKTHLKSGKRTKDITVQSNLNPTAKDFVSKMNLNNPFRTFLKEQHRDNDSVSDSPLNVSSLSNCESPYLSPTNLLSSLGSYISKSTSLHTLTSDSSDYKEYMPEDVKYQEISAPSDMSSVFPQNDTNILDNQTNLNEITSASPVDTPANYLNQYPQWLHSESQSYQYPQWSNGNISVQDLDYFNNIRPPPGFNIPRNYPYYAKINPVMTIPSYIYNSKYYERSPPTGLVVFRPKEAQEKFPQGHDISDREKQ